MLNSKIALQEKVINGLIHNFGIKKKHIKTKFKLENFKIRPDIVTDATEKWAIYLRSSSFASDVYWGLFAQTKFLNPEYKLFLCAPKSVISKFKRQCAVYDIGLIEINSDVKFVRKPSPSKQKFKRTKKPHQKQRKEIKTFFLSSKQDLTERRKAEKIIEDYCRYNNAFADICKLEYRGRSSTNMWKQIKPEIKGAKYFLAILTDKYSEFTIKEIKYALSKHSGITNNRISIMVKDIPAKQRHKELNKFLKWLENRIKYTRYPNKKFKDILIQELTRIASR